VKVEAVLPVAQFLARAWGNAPQLTVVFNYGQRSNAYAFTTKERVYIPPPSRFPVTDAITAYRLWRAVLWHEAMHHSQGSFKRLSKSEVDYYYTGSSSTFYYVVDVIEDYYVETKGYAEYPGMRKERQLVKAVAWKLMQPPSNVLEEFMQYLLFGAVKNVRVKDEVRRAVEYVKEALSVEPFDTYSVARRVFEILGIQNERYLPMRNPYSTILEGNVKKRELEEVVKEYIEETQDIEETSSEDPASAAEEICEVPEEVVEEFKEIRAISEQIEKHCSKTRMEVQDVILPSRLNIDESKYYDQELITHLKAQLRQLRRGWKEIASRTGEFDVDSYVQRHAKAFIDEEQLKVGGVQVLLLLDHSDSITWYERKYKTACIALAEALSALNIKFAVYAFTGYIRTENDTLEPSVYLIKSFREKWTRMNAKRLAQVSTGGSTPMTEVYEKLEPQVKGKSKLIFITLTDGEPNNKVTCADRIKHLKKYCRMVAIAIGHNVDSAVKLANNLGRLGYDRYVAVDDVKKIPEKVLRLLEV